MPENSNPCADCGEKHPMLYSTHDNTRPGFGSVAVCIPCFNKRNPDAPIKG